MIRTGSEFLCVGKNADNRTAYFLILRNLSGLESDVCGQVKEETELWCKYSNLAGSVSHGVPAVAK